MQNVSYGLLTLAGILITLFFWSRLVRYNEKLFVVYAAALFGAFLGAKVVYIAAEGWLHFSAPDFWWQVAIGKSILGALLGGYLAVEMAKKWLGYPAPTGDWFALVVPVGIILGRIGCLLYGCCLGERFPPAWFTLNDSRGTARWPAVPVEILFNLLAIGGTLWLRRTGLLKHQHFHIYLIAYGIFRFAHEFVRATPQILGTFSGYHIAALSVTVLGLAGFLKRRTYFKRIERV